MLESRLVPYSFDSLIFIMQVSIRHLSNTHLNYLKSASFSFSATSFLIDCSNSISNVA